VSLIFYTDGSCKLDLGTYAWAWVLCDDNKEIASDSGAGEGINKGNNKAELTAAVQAMRYAVENNIPDVVLVTDSSFVTFNDKYAELWKKNQWKISNGQPCAEPALSDEFLKLRETIRKNGTFEVRHIKGHQGIPGNDRADALAGEAREKYELDHKLVTEEACPKIQKKKKAEATNYRAIQFLQTVAAEEVPDQILHWKYNGYEFGQSRTIKTYDVCPDAKGFTALPFTTEQKEYPADNSISEQNGFAFFQLVEKNSWVVPTPAKYQAIMGLAIARQCQQEGTVAIYTAVSADDGQKYLYIGTLAKSQEEDAWFITEDAPLMSLPRSIPAGLVAFLVKGRKSAVLQAVNAGAEVNFVYVPSRKEVLLLLQGKAKANATWGVLMMPSNACAKTLKTLDGVHMFAPSTGYLHDYTGPAEKEEVMEQKQEVVFEFENLVKLIQETPDEFVFDKEGGLAYIKAFRGISDVLDAAARKQRKLLNNMVKTFSIGKEIKEPAQSQDAVAELLQKALNTIKKKG